MMNKKITKSITGIIVLVLLMTNLAGCGQTEQGNLTITGFAFDTTYTITLYQGGSQKLLDSCVEKCSDYEKIFSRTLKSSELYQLNEVEKLYYMQLKEVLGLSDEGKVRALKKNGHFDIQLEEGTIERLKKGIEQTKPKENTIEYEIAENGSISFTLSDMLRDIMKKGLEYSGVSAGSFDITVEPVTSLWNFKAENRKVPKQEKLEEALAFVGYQKASLEGNRLVLQEPGMGIDLGGIAKGFIADDLKNYLKEQGVSSATINLGGNVLCIGAKNEKEPFRIGIQQPFADRNQTIAAVKVQDLSVVSSGIYERYFQTEDGILYHHIINPKTGYSYENDLLGVTILSEKSVDGDGLSTTCFALGKEEGLNFINSLEGVYALFITKDEKLWYSEGFEDYLLE